MKTIKLKKLKSKFLLIFAFAFMLANTNVFADDDGGGDDSGDGSASEASVSDDADDSDSEYTEGSDDDGNYTITDSEGNTIVSVGYDDVYDDAGAGIFHGDNEEIEDMVYEHFKSEMFSRIGSTADALARLYDAAVTALARATASKNAEKIAEAQADLDEAKSKLDRFCEAHNFHWNDNKIKTFIYDDNNEIVASAGDPVFVALGKFFIDDSDISISNGKSAFSIERHFISDGTEKNVAGNSGKPYLERFHGAFGTLWTSNLDTRIIQGINSLSDDILETCFAYAAELAEAETEISGYAQEDSECEPILAEIQQMIAENIQKIDFYEKEIASRNEIEESIRFVDYGIPGSFNGSLSSNILIYCGDSGDFIVFEKSFDEAAETADDDEDIENVGFVAQNEIYLPLSASFKNKVTLEKNDSGFLVNFINSGEKRHYSKYGFPVLFEYENGSSVIFDYDENFYLSKISLDSFHFLEFSWKGNLLESVSDGERKISFGYDGENLAFVTDFENDTRYFEYDSEGFLTKQIKADGSFVSFEYENLEDEKVVRVVTDESGKSEYFDYDFSGRKTAYTNPDGEVTLFFYDENNRTTKIHHPDGSEENWLLDESGNVKEWNNGGVYAKYDYDSFGKIIEKNDEFGAEETFSYDENRLVAWKNKNGVLGNFSYDENGNIVAVYSNGELLKSYSYKNGLLEKETDCRGNSFLYFYDDKGNLIKTYLSEQGKSQVLIESYEYDSQNRIKKSLGVDGITRFFSYDDHTVIIRCANQVKITKKYSSRKLTLSEEIEDELTGEIIRKEYEYDKNGRCDAVYISGKNSDGKSTGKFLLSEYGYSSAGKISRKVTWNLDEKKSEKSGTEILYFYDSAGNVCEIKKRKIGGGSDGEEKTVKLISRKTQTGNIVTEISGNIEKSFSFDLRGNLLEEKIGETVLSSKKYSASGMLLSEKSGAWMEHSFNYDFDGFLSSVMEENSVKTKGSSVLYFPDGKIKESSDSDGNKTYYEYNGLGMMTRVSSPFKTAEYSYDFCGKLISKTIKDEQNRVVFDETWDYSDFGRKVFHKIGGKLVEKMIINGFGLLKSKSDSVENQWIFSYDILGRKTRAVNPYGKCTSFFWNENNLLEKAVFPDGSYQRYFYDLNLKCIKIEDNAGILQKSEYDDAGRIVQFSRRPFSAPEKYEYDDFGRVTKVTKNGKTLLSNSYDDSKKQTRREDACGNLSFWNFDGAERSLSVVNRIGGKSENEWNNDGKIKSLLDFNGTKALYSYKKSGLERTVNYSTGEFLSSGFDVLGNLLFACNENSSLSFEYDSSGSLVYQKNSESDVEIQFKYENGRLERISCGEIEIAYEYGKCGEILKITEKSGLENSNQSMQITFEYDSCGREISRKWSTGESMKIFYDCAGREILRTGFSSAHGLVFVEGFVYDKNGFKSLVLDSDFNYKRYEYDDFGRVKSVSYPYSAKKAEHLKSSIENAGLYSLSGTEKFNYESLSAFEYDALKKLCELAGETSILSSGLRKTIKEVFEYDPNSNLVKRITPYGSISYVYDKNDRLISWGNGCSANYDANGNMIFLKNVKKQVKMEYNSANRLSKIHIEDFEKDELFSSTYEYDALGRRTKSTVYGKGETKTFYVGKTGQELFSIFTPSASFYSTSSSARVGEKVSSPKIRYKFRDDASESSVFDEANLSENSQDSNYEDNYFLTKSVAIFSPDGEILQLLSENDDSTGEAFSFMTGTTGTVNSSVDEDDLLSLHEYDEFGFPLETSGKKSKYGFIGKKFDSATEFYDFGYRDYSPVFGRFSTEDPVLDGRNWYSYCAGDYVNFFDPNGLLMAATKAQNMQSMGETALLGNSSGTLAKDEGCVVTAIAETLTVLTGRSITPSDVNNLKSNFNGTEVVEKYRGDINWDNLYKNYGLVHTNILTADLKKVSDKASNFDKLSTHNASMVWNCCTDKSMSIENYISTIMQSPKDTVVVLQVVYGIGKNNEGKEYERLHYVVANSDVVMINGKSYVNITPTSLNDTSVGAGSLRGNVGWIEKNGKIYVPVDDINRIDTLTKGK